MKEGGDVGEEVIVRIDGGDGKDLDDGVTVRKVDDGR